MATPKQVEFISDLLDERDLLKSSRVFDTVNAMDQQEFDAWVQVQKDRASTLDVESASAWITRLLELPKKQEAQPQRRAGIETDVPAGRYAITGQDDTTDFYKVDRPTEGRWAGYVFVKLLVAHGGFGDDLTEQRMNFGATRGILSRIEEAGVRESMERYGREIGSCGHCGRTLTNADSIKRGIGPVCAGKMGWSW